MICPLCQKRPAKRACPALRHDICTVCCATKRLVEIQCTEDCRYLEAAQRHPAAVIKRQIDRDVTVLMATVGRLSEQQLQLFFLLQSMVLSYKPEGLARLDRHRRRPRRRRARRIPRDGEQRPDLRGVHRLRRGEGLRRALKPVIDEVTKGGGIPRRARGGDRPARRWNAAPSTRAATFPTATRRISSSSAGCFQQRPPRRPRQGPQKPLIVLP